MIKRIKVIYDPEFDRFYTKKEAYESIEDFTFHSGILKPHDTEIALKEVEGELSDLFYAEVYPAYYSDKPLTLNQKDIFDKIWEESDEVI